ncbi:MAG: hypothetical protein E7Z63_01200 [Thermoplasmata archaeon]|jgi:V/A-type H+-transporting ATPase subunit E|nr:hypothetical protein [Thermoplasmata archaeon]
MALESVTKEIEADAQARAAIILKQKDKDIAEINAKADAQIAEMKEKQDKRVAETVGNLARQERSSAELESKKVVLSKKKDVLNRAFETALADLENMPANKKLAYYKAMVASAKDVIPEPKAVISVNDKFTAADLGVTAVEQSNKIRSGIILQSEDGKIEVDMQFSVLLKSVWDSNIKEITDILFESKEEAAAEAPAEEAESEVALG